MVDAQQVSNDDIEFAKQLGFSEEEAQKMAAQGEMLPALQVPKPADKEITGPKVFASFAENKFTPVTTKENEEALIIAVEDDEGIRHNLWARPKSSVAAGVFKLYNVAKKEGQELKGKRFGIWKEEYQHPKYGPTLGTRMQFVDKKLDTAPTKLPGEAAAEKQAAQPEAPAAPAAPAQPAKPAEPAAAPAKTEEEKKKEDAEGFM